MCPRALIDDPDDPAGLLADRRLQGVGKVLADTDDAGVPLVPAERCGRGGCDPVLLEDREPDEHLRHPPRPEPEADVVVLGETLHVERDAVAVGQQCHHGAPAEARSNTGAGDLARQGLAHEDVLAV